MKRTLIVLFTFTSVLFVTASTLSAAGPKGKAEIEFSQGLLAYHQQKYAVAEGHFRRATQWDTEHRGAAHFLGMSLFKQDRYQEAARAFETAIRLNPDDAEPHFYRGLSFYRLNQKKRSLPDLKKAAELAPWDSPVREAAKSLVKNIEGGGAPASAGGGSKRWFLNAGLSLNYDSNVSLNPESLSLASLPSQRNDVGFIPRVGGGYHLLQREHYRLTALASYSQSLYPTLSQFNYGLLHSEVSNQFRWGKLSLRLPAAYEFALLGSSPFFSSFVSRPGVSYFWNNRFLTQLTPQFRLNNFSQTLLTRAQNRDAWNLNPALDQYWMIFDQRHFVKFGYAYEQNWADGNDWDYHAHDVNGELLLPLPHRLDLDLKADFLLDKHFDNVDSVLGARRNDSGQSYGASVSRKFFNQLTASLSYTFTRNVSNLPLFTYNRHIGGVTFATDF